MTTAREKPLRRDAERNRQLILDAAEELFGQRGLGVTLNDIAHHAGVGVGTVYRRFPDRTKLIEGLFEQKLEELVALMQTAVANPDPWSGLAYYLESAIALQSENLALRDLVLSSPDGLEHVCRVRERLMPLGTELMQRAQASGQIRAELSSTDLPMILMMVMGVADATRAVDPDVWRRYLAIVLQGIRAEPSPPGPLTPPPLEPSAVDAVMSASPLVRR